MTEQPAGEHCGSTKPHGRHKVMRGRVVAWCPGPVPEQPGRHTVDTLTSDALDQLYAELAQYRNALNWQTDCLSCARVLDSVYRETMRAEQAEAALARVRAYAARLDRFADDTVSPDDRALYRALATDLRTALDPQEPTP